MTTLYAQWLQAKDNENAAVSERRRIEDEMVKHLGITPDLNGSTKFKREGFTVKVEGRINRKIDAEKLQLLAAEAGISEHLSSLFRWKPEQISRAWNAADEAVTKPLLGAITATPGRPTFTITKG